MRSVVVHAVLLVVALTAATLTWTASNRQFGASDAVVVWDFNPDDLVELTFRDGTNTFVLERRGEGADSYLWAKQTHPAAPTGGEAITGLEASSGALATDEYPVGVEADRALESLVHMRAVRDLGEADSAARERFGLVDSLPALDLRFADGTERSLILSVEQSGGARYMLDVEENRVYAILVDIVSPLEQGAATLRLTELQRFSPEDVGSMTLTNAAGESRERFRRVEGIPPRTGWVKEGENGADVVFSNLVEQIRAMFVITYKPELSEADLQLIGRADYEDTRGRPLGWMEFYRSKGEGPVVYYLKTPRTVVLAEFFGTVGQQFERTLVTLFREP